MLANEIHTSEDIDNLSAEETPLAVLFILEGCPFCHAFLPHFETYMQENQFTYTYGIFESADGDESLIEENNVTVFPTVIVFEKGKATKRINGVPDEGLDEGDLEELG